MKTFASLYTHNRSRSKAFGTVNNEPSMTQQTDRDDTDINVIVGRFMKTGQIPVVSAQAISGDFTNAGDFRSMLDQVTNAQRQFNELPAGVRSRFNNNPAEFIEFATQKGEDGKLANLAELRKMKLAPEPAPPPEPMLVRIQEAPKP